MKIKKIGQWCLLLMSVVIFQACASSPQPSQDLLAPTEAQMKLRSIQTRTFDIQDPNQAMRGVLAALQDLGFIIERTNETLGLVTAAKFVEPNYLDVMEVTITIRQKTEAQKMIRINAVFNNKPLEDSKVYQNFFASLERSLFISKE